MPQSIMHMRTGMTYTRTTQIETTRSRICCDKIQGVMLSMVGLLLCELVLGAV